MKREEERYEQWLERVRNTSPVLENPENLTRDILQKIAQTPQRKRKSGRLVNWVSAVAAVGLLCFMVHETCFYSAAPVIKGEVVVTNTSFSLPKLPELPKGVFSGMSMKERSAYLSKLWKERTEMKRRQQRAIEKLINSNH
ncbi:hypothetical protein [Phocaeicola sp.]